MATPKTKVRTNHQINVPEVRVIGPDGNQVGVMPTQKAILLAEENNLDLVEISPAAKPPVCKVMNFGKFQFEEAKKAHTARKKQKQIQIKEIKFRPGTDIGDYQVKIRNLIRFLTEGDKAKVTLRFRGREMQHQELGLQLLKRVESDLAPYGLVEQYPRLEGKQMVMILSPIKTTKRIPTESGTA